MLIKGTIEDRAMKYEALKWLRLQQRCLYLSTEVGGNSADCLGINEKKMIEVEVKKTLGDLRADFKKHKHYEYRNSLDATRRWTPNIFYFLVPSELVEPCRELLVQHKCDKYGIISFPNMVVMKRASRLHDRLPDNQSKLTTALRMGSELLRLWEAWQ